MHYASAGKISSLLTVSTHCQPTISGDLRRFNIAALSFSYRFHLDFVIMSALTGKTFYSCHHERPSGREGSAFLASHG
jgi:hypothetical protein